MSIEVIPTKAALGTKIRRVDLAYAADEHQLCLIAEAYDSLEPCDTDLIYCVPVNAISASPTPSSTATACV